MRAVFLYPKVGDNLICPYNISQKHLSKTGSKGATAVRSFVERVRAGTFDKAIKRGTPIELRFNHNKKLGDTTSNLELYEDNIGLYARAAINDVEVIEKAQRGELRGWSFGFIAEGETWDKEGEIDRRTLEDIDLKEVSILDKTPAYFGTLFQ